MFLFSVSKLQYIQVVISRKIVRSVHNRGILRKTTVLELVPGWSYRSECGYRSFSMSKGANYISASIVTLLTVPVYWLNTARPKLVADGNARPIRSNIRVENTFLDYLGLNSITFTHIVLNRNVDGKLEKLIFFYKIF